MEIKENPKWVESNVNSGPNLTPKGNGHEFKF